MNTILVFVVSREYRKYIREELQQVVAESTSLVEVLRKLGRSPVGGNSNNLARRLLLWDIDTSHFVGQAHNRGKPSNKRKSADSHLTLGTSTDPRKKGSLLTRCLTEKGVEYKCNNCGISEWMGKRLILEVDHIDEQYWNNLFENLQFLCPNCHAMKNR